MIINLIKKSEVSKIKISMHVSFISSKNTGETRTRKNTGETRTDNIIREPFESFLNNYQREEKIISGSEFNFQNVDLMDYKLHKVSLKTGGSYIKSTEWLINKTATVNPKNEKDDKCFQYAIALSLIYNKIKKKELKSIF